LRGLAQLAWTEMLWPREAELATSVEPAWRGRGVGSTLVARALRTARNRGIRRITLVCLAENAPMLRIARKLESEIEFSDELRIGHIDPGLPDPGSLMEEWLEDGAAFVETLALGWRPAAAY
jgi:RimJ/RimL family protein N-acetyltransferase